MADRILGTLLKALERVYRFPSAQKGAPDSVELDLPIQTVHDLSNIAEYGSGLAPINDGFWVFTNRHVHAAGGTLVNTPTPFDTSLPVANGFPANRGGGITEMVWWFYNTWCETSSGGNYSSSRDYIVHGSATVGPYVTGASLQKMLLHYWIGQQEGSCVEDSDSLVWKQWPIRVLQNPSSTISAYWRCQSVSTGATNIDFNMMCWFGPKGILAPGVR